MQVVVDELVGITLNDFGATNEVVKLVDFFNGYNL
jgi:hypothetical protein